MLRKINALIGLARRTFRLRPEERRLALEALTALASARLTLALLPFPTAMRRLGLRAGRMEAETAADAAVREAVAAAIRRAARVAPFRAVCLQRAVAAALLLRRRAQPVEVHFGLARDSDGLAAHAWAMCGGLAVTGEERRGAFTPIAMFTP